jgi:purine-nucleoside phosphorylase
MTIMPLTFLLGIRSKEIIADKIVLSPFVALNRFKQEFTSIDKTFSGKTGYKGFTGNINGQRLSVINTGLGTLPVGDLVLWLKDMVRTVMLVGSVGTLSGELQIGDYFIPDTAIDGEGFTHYHLQNPSQRFLTANQVRLTDNMRSKCGRFTVKRGTVYTIGSLYAEQDTMFLEFLKNQGVSALDMETSAFYTAAQKAGIDALAFHYVSDRPLEKPFYEKLSNEDQLRLNYAVEGFPKTVLDVLCAIKNQSISTKSTSPLVKQ